MSVFAESSPLLCLSGGGSGGHLTPGLAVAEAWIARVPRGRVLFVGSERPLEKAMLGQAGFEHIALPIDPLSAGRKNPFRFAWRGVRSLVAARRLLKERSPAIVVGLGGYACAPLVLAAGMSRVPVVLLEQNAIAGKAVRWLSRFASRICLTYAESQSTLTSSLCVVTGNPVRSPIANIADSLPETSIADRDTLLILGGSQGAQALNRAILSLVSARPELFRNLRIVHQTGAVMEAEARDLYSRLGIQAEAAAFFHDLPARYPTTRLVISRAGATTLAELACAAVPAILVPFPLAADDHQRRNAQIHAERGAAVLVEQQGTPEALALRLGTHLEDLSSNSDQLARMTQAMRSMAVPRAADNVVDEILRLISAMPAPA